jgi:hypothetical protein
VRKLVRVNGNTSPTAVAVPVAPSDNRNSVDNRFGKWGSSPAPDRPDSFDNRFGNWGTSPAAGSGNPGSPVLRALQNYKGSAAPDRPTSAQGASPETPAFQPDAVYSPTGDFFGNFPRVSAVAATQSPTAFNEPGSSSAPRMAGDFNTLWGLPHNSKASGNSDWFNLLAGLASRNSTQPAPAE